MCREREQTHGRKREVEGKKNFHLLAYFMWAPGASAWSLELCLGLPCGWQWQSLEPSPGLLEYALGENCCQKLEPRAKFRSSDVECGCLNSWTIHPLLHIVFLFLEFTALCVFPWAFALCLFILIFVFLFTVLVYGWRSCVVYEKSVYLEDGMLAQSGLAIGSGQ